MAFVREAFKPKVNTALKEADIKNGASPILWSIEDIIEVYGGFPRRINDQTVLRYKIDFQSILDREKQTLLNEFKNNIDKEIENKILRETNKIREDILEKQTRVQYLRNGGTSLTNKNVSIRSPSRVKSKTSSKKNGHGSFGLDLINNFLSKFKEIDFNTDMRFIEVDDRDPYLKNKATGGGVKRGNKTKKINYNVKKTKKRRHFY
jgi:hypothetical protein